MRNPNRFLLKSLIYGIGLTIPVVSQAELEEVIVTAQKRAESLSDVPVAVTAYTGEGMKALGITDASDLVEITPGLTAADQSGSNKNYFLRGVGTSDFHLTAAGAVGQYYDGITLTSGFHARAALFDMERVEVLKGPQNALFGLNTTGGAVNYITKKPEIGAGINGSFTMKMGSDSLVNTETAVGFDITDNLAARVAVQTNKHDGPFKSITNGKDYGDDDMQAWRAALLWQPSDVTSIAFNMHGMRSENNGTVTQALGTRDPDGSGNVCSEFRSELLDFERNTNCISRGFPTAGGPATAPELSMGVDPSTGDWDTVSQGAGLEDIETKGYYLSIEHDFAFATLNFTTAFDNLKLQSQQDNDGGPGLGNHLHQEDDRDTYQHEVRLTSNGDGDFRWIGGVYYLDEEADSMTGGRSPFGAFRSPAGSGILFGNSYPNVQLAHTKENIGVYVQGEYDLSDAITATVGVRWSDEEITADYLPSNPNITGLDINTPLFSSDVDALVFSQIAANNAIASIGPLDANGYEIARQLRQELNNEDVGYTVKLDWKATEDSMIYLSNSRGFKGAAADVRAVFATFAVANLQKGLDSARLEPESLDVWELGYKASFWDNRISFDGAIFHYTYENLQQFVNVGGAPTLENAPETEIMGFDGNVKYANDSGFFLDLGFSLLDSEITDAGDSLFSKGAELGNTPEYSFSIVAAQDFALKNGNEITLTVNVNHTAEHVKQTLVTSADLTTAVRSRPETTLLNANLNYRFGGEQQYALAIFGNNLTDEHYCGGMGVDSGNSVFENGFKSFHQNVTCRATRASTRTVGASFSVEF